jgi:diguanylate cyclase (GGDEF)-like protein/PAS domain S-box-containing protein
VPRALLAPSGKADEAVIAAAELVPLLDFAHEAGVVVRRRGSSRPASEILYVNRALLQLTGFEAAQLLGRSVRLLRGRDMPRERFARLLGAMAGGEPFAGRMSLARADGGSKTVAVRGEPLPGAEEHYALWLEPVASRATLLGERAETGERGLFPSGLSAECFYTMTVGPDCRLELDWADERLAALTGLEPAELLAAGALLGLVLPQDLPELQKRNQAVLGGRQAVAEYRIRARDGRERWLRDTARPEYADSEEFVARVVGAVRDVTHERRLGDPERLRERHAALLAQSLHALVVVLEIGGRIRWVSAEPATPLAESVRAGCGLPLEAILGARDVDEWLDWIEQAVGVQERVGFCFHGTLAGETVTLDVLLSPLDDETVLAVIRPLGRQATAAIAGNGGAAPTPAAPSLPMAGTLLDALGGIAFVLGADLVVGEANGAALRATGLERGDVVGRPFAELIEGEDARIAMRAVLERAGAGERAPPLQAPLSVGSGPPLRLEWHVLLLTGEAGRPAGFLVTALPLAAAGEPAPGVDRNEPWLSAVLDSVADGIVTITAAGTIQWFSRSAEAIFGLAREEAVGRAVDRLLTAGPAAEPDIQKLLIERSRGDGVPSELFGRRRSGEVIPIEVRVTPLAQDGEQLLILTIRDITLRRQTEETLKNLAYLDPLTGLPNRLLFHDRLAQGIERARRNRQMLTVMLIDLDRFKLINDSLGLERGDQVLKAVGDRLVAVLRRSDTVARLGGDEFMLLLAATASAEAAAKVAQKALDALRPTLLVDVHELTIAASIGIAIYPYDGDDADTLIKNADSALSRAKEQGRNHYQFYTNDMNASAFERLMLESRLRKALEQNELVVYYQPQVNIASGEITGVEALVRWFHPDLGMVPPAEFIPLAEETGLIVPIGDLVLKTACAAGRRLRDLGFTGLRVAGNLSARQFQQHDLGEQIAQVLHETGLAATDLELELTESVIMRDAPEIQRRLRELTAQGIQLAVDDFGTGYSSLGYLRTFPIRSLKIDRSFIRDIDRDPNGAAIAQAIIALAASLGLKVIAEGVETKEQLDLLRRYGCQEMQGFLFSRPVPADELLSLLREGRRLEV